MILRRLAEHVKSQNWFAVFVETMIVILGVFLGLQVNNWNAARIDRDEAAGVLDRLEQDFEQNLVQVNLGLAAHEGNLAAAARLIEGVRRKRLSEETLLEDVRVVGNFSPPPGPSMTYLELVSGGRVRLIRDDALRRMLSGYNDYVTFVRSQYASISGPLLNATEVLMAAEALDANGLPADTREKFAAATSVDRDRLINDPSMLSSLQMAYRTQDAAHAVLAQLRARIIDILGVIRTEQQKTT